jgi:hypothetical protein
MPTRRQRRNIAARVERAGDVKALGHQQPSNE